MKIAPAPSRRNFFQDEPAVPDYHLLMHAPSVTFWRTRPGLEISRVEASTHVFPAHFHDDLYAIGLMHVGASFCQGPRHAETILLSGQACLINPGQIHSGVPVQEATLTYSMIYIHAHALRDMAQNLAQDARALPEFTTMICTRPDLVSALARLVRVQTATCGELEQESALIGAVGDLLRAHGGVSGPHSSREPHAVRRARDILGSSLEQKITLQELADTVGLSQYHLLRQFKRQTGVPPHVFRTQRRVEHARILIRQGMPLAEVAQATGFTDQAHFTNTFKLYTGATPGQYANRHHSASRQGAFA